MSLGLSIAFIGVGGLVLASYLYLTIRNMAVHNYRMELLVDIRDANMRDIRLGFTNYERRYEWFDTVSYTDMLYSFKDLDEFYPDRDVMLKPPVED